MNQFLNLQTFISIVALVVSVATYVWTVHFHKEKKERDRVGVFTSFFNNLIEVESQLKNVPTAMRFHGVDQKELKKYGITSNEFAYLLTSFTAAGIYYNIYEPDETTPFNVNTDEYRYKMCKSEATRNSWPLLKKFINVGNYRTRIESTIFESDSN